MNSSIPCLLATGLLIASVSVAAAEDNGAFPRHAGPALVTDRILVKWRAIAEVSTRPPRSPIALRSWVSDGNGREADASDPGDWIDSGDIQQPEFTDCSLSDSSWHGTRVSGLIAARTNNGIGVAGEAWNAWILPARVLGKCGGFDSDIIAAMRWAAGLAVAGVPSNPYPARIINLSLGLLLSVRRRLRSQ